MKTLEGSEEQEKLEVLKELKRVYTSGILMWIPILGIFFGFREIYFWILGYYSIWHKWRLPLCILNGVYQAGWIVLILKDFI